MVDLEKVVFYFKKLKNYDQINEIAMSYGVQFSSSLICRVSYYVRFCALCFFFFSSGICELC